MFSIDRQYEDLLRDGITAAKNDQRRLAQSLLRQAIMMNGADARPYIWLSATTDDPAEKREYLEMAVAIDPNNSGARRGLALLTGKIDTTRLMQENQVGEAVPSQGETAPGEVPPAPSQEFKCSNCGGRINFNPADNELVCDYCGFRQPRSAVPGAGFSPEGVVEFVLPTSSGHNWAQNYRRISCRSCGAHSLLQPGQATVRCAYCGGNAFVDVIAEAELLDPQGIIPLKVDVKEAARAVRKWLGNGFFAPDDLVAQVRQFNLRPAYYSFWLFNGTMFLNWSCEVRGRSDQWEDRSGIETRFMRDALVPGVKALQAADVESIEPFQLDGLRPFDPEFLAGWPALVYDRSMADASLLARERLVKQVRRKLSSLVEPRREKRNLTSRHVEWSGMTYKHLLLPVWVGAYHYNGKEYHLLVNGQTGKVGGYKPRDMVKIVLLVMMGVVVLGLLAWLLGTGVL